MRLETVWVNNFRCHYPEKTLPISDLTAVVGKNDAGKSAFFEAIRVFFGETKPDQHDACKSSDTSLVKIACIFSDLPDSIVVDAAYPTSLADEELLNSDGYFEVVQTWDCGLKTPKLISVEAIAECSDNPELQGLLSQTNSKLKATAKALGIDEETYNAAINAQIRAAIRGHFINRTKSERVVSLNKEGGKKIWDLIKTQLPAVAFFQADRPSTDQDDEAQDPLQNAVKRAIDRESERLTDVFKSVQAEADFVAKATVEQVRAFNEELAGTLTPNIIQGSWDKVFKTTITGDDEVPFNKRGSGVRRLILFSFYRAQQNFERERGSRGSVIYLVEEPETGQHPSNQRLVVAALKELSEEENAQVILSTHSPMLCRALPLESVRYLRHQDGDREIIADCRDDNIIQEVSRALGVLPDHNVKLFICVEGINDENFLVNLSSLLIDFGFEDIPNLRELRLNGSLIFVPLGGSTLAQSVGRLRNLNVHEFHLYDRDNPLDEPAAYQDTIDAVNLLEGCSARCTNKRELENYVHGQAITLAYASNGIHIDIPDTFEDFDDVPMIVAKAVYNSARAKDDTMLMWENLEEKKQKSKSSYAKKQINDASVLLMDRTMYLSLDTENELRNMLVDIGQFFTD